MSEPPAYEIRTIADIAKIPRERWPAFAKDLLAWLETREEITAELNKMLEGVATVPLPDSMIWKDDEIVGITGIQLHMRHPPATTTPESEA